MDIDQMIDQIGFCSKLNHQQLEDEIISCRLLGSKISSSQEYWLDCARIAMAHMEKRYRFGVNPMRSYLEHCLIK